MLGFSLPAQANNSNANDRSTGPARIRKHRHRLLRNSSFIQDLSLRCFMLWLVARRRGALAHHVECWAGISSVMGVAVAKLSCAGKRQQPTCNCCLSPYCPRVRQYVVVSRKGWLWVCGCMQLFQVGFRRSCRALWGGVPSVRPISVACCRRAIYRRIQDAIRFFGVSCFHLGT